MAYHGKFGSDTYSDSYYPYYDPNSYTDANGYPYAGSSSHQRNSAGRNNQATMRAVKTHGAGMNSAPRPTSPTRRNSNLPSRPDRRTAPNGNSDRQHQLIPPQRRDFSMQQFKADVEASISSLIGCFQRQQDARKEKLEAEANNAKYERHRTNDNISKEYKIKAEDALTALREATRKEAESWSAVQTRLTILLADVLKHYRDRAPERVENGVSGASIRGADTSIIESRDINEDAVTPDTPPLPGAREDSGPELGEGVLSNNANRPSGSAPTASAIAGGEAATTVTSTDRFSKGTGKERGPEDSTISRTTVKRRLDNFEDALMNCEERMDQFESVIEEVVRQEVEARVKKAAQRKRQRKEIDYAASKEQEDKSKAVENQREQAVRPSMASPEIEEGEVRPSPATPNVLATTATAPPSAQGGSIVPHPVHVPAPRPSDVAPPSVGSEQVRALIESLGQEMREEYDKKLYQQEQTLTAALKEIQAQVQMQVQARVRTATEGLNTSLTKLYEMIGGQSTNVHRHDQVINAILSLLSNVPKPNPNQS